MALPGPGEAGPQDKVCYLPDSNPQLLAAYYTHLTTYGHYRSTVASKEEGFQPFWPPEAAVSAAPAMPPFAYRMAPPVLNPGLAPLQREPLYDVSWYAKQPPFYPFSQLPREFPHFLNSSHEVVGASSGDSGPVGGRGDSAQWCGSETLISTAPVDASGLPEGLKTTSQSLSCSSSQRPEDDPGSSNQEGKSPGPFHFTEKDLHLVLYGVTPSLEHPAGLHHAISGLLVPTSSSGSNSLSHTVDKDSLQLPEGLCLMKTMFGEVPHFGVFCSSFIAKGMRFGPFQGKVVNTSEVKTYGDNSLMWEIFEDGQLSHFIDGKGKVACTYVYVGVKYNMYCLLWVSGKFEKCFKVGMNPRGSCRCSTESAENFWCESVETVCYRDYRDKHLKSYALCDKGDRRVSCSLSGPPVHILHCSTCGKCFSQSSSLNKHMRVHSGDRPYQCVYCTKKFTASSILRTHIRQHSGEKPFKCKHCGKSFASHAAHDSHVRRSHKEDEGGSCGICGKAFPDQKTFYSHMKLHGDR
uniref:PR/SET domain 14 n=1 Tax=Microcebus murinus TaxID=30608 RepID=A0A8C5UNQ3_MICMU